ncbi:MAG: hypothetical protein ACO3QV_07065 [Candidatus Nanopelagicaceae bacterium]
MSNSNTVNLTPDLIAEMCEKDQMWLFRSLILLGRYMEHDLKGYRTKVGKVDNRNSVRYWLEWMSRTLIHRNMTLQQIHAGTPSVMGDPNWWTQNGRYLSRTHLDSCLTFIRTDSVKNLIYALATRDLTIPSL